MLDEANTNKSGLNSSPTIEAMPTQEKFKNIDELVDRLFMTLLQNMVYSLDELQDEWYSSVKKVLSQINYKSDMVPMMTRQIIKDVESNSQLVLSNLFKSLYYLNEISEEKLTSEECHTFTNLIDEQFFQIKKESISEIEIKSFSYFLKVLRSVDYKEKELLEKIITFFAKSYADYWFEVRSNLGEHR